MCGYIWAGRSVGRSLHWHCRGREFKSRPVHFSAVYSKGVIFSTGLYTDNNNMVNLNHLNDQIFCYT